VTPLNLCGSCRRDFTSLELFDAHRVGKHKYSYSEGLELSPIREDGRRCLSDDEMTGRGWLRDVRRRWLNLARAERGRRLAEAA
jgi:hypothetical protein